MLEMTKKMIEDNLVYKNEMLEMTKKMIEDNNNKLNIRSQTSNNHHHEEEKKYKEIFN